MRQAIALPPRIAVGDGWRVVRTSEAALLERARASYAALPAERRASARRGSTFGSSARRRAAQGGLRRRRRDDHRAHRDHPRAGDASARSTRRAARAARPARRDAVRARRARRRGARAGPLPADQRAESPAPAGDRRAAPAPRLGARGARSPSARAAIERARVAPSPQPRRATHATSTPATRRCAFDLVASVFTLDDARAAAAAGATEIVLDPFLRHPDAAGHARAGAAPRSSRAQRRHAAAAHADDRSARGAPQRAEVARPRPAAPQRTSRARRRAGARRARRRRRLRGQLLQPAHRGRAVPRSARGASSLSVELTTDELLAARRRRGRATASTCFLYGRPEGMTIEHCVLSAAFDREPTTCRDLCVQKHTNVELTDPAGYTFPVATDSACRNRLLHSRPVEGGEFLPRLWRGGHSRLSPRVQRRRRSDRADRLRLSRDARAARAPAQRQVPNLARAGRAGRVHARALRACGLATSCATRRMTPDARRSAHAHRMTHRRAPRSTTRAPCCARASAIPTSAPDRSAPSQSVLARPRHARRAADRRRQVALLSGAGADAARAHRRRLARSSR